MNIIQKIFSTDKEEREKLILCIYAIVNTNKKASREKLFESLLDELESGDKQRQEALDSFVPGSLYCVECRNPMLEGEVGSMCNECQKEQDEL